MPYFPIGYFPPTFFPLGSGESPNPGTGELSDESIARIIAALKQDREWQAVKAAADRLLSVGDGESPLDPLPAYTPPNGLVRIRLRTDFLGKPTPSSAQVKYADDDRPLLDESVTLVQESGSFYEDTAKFGSLLGIEIKPSAAILYAVSGKAALNKNTALFDVREGDDGKFLDELIVRYQIEHPLPTP